MEISQRVKHLLLEICEEFKLTTNITKNYIEYISVLLYLKYLENGKHFYIIYMEREDVRRVAKIIDDMVELVRSHLENKILFSNIQFETIIKSQEYQKRNFLKLLIEKIYSLDTIIGEAKSESKKIVAKAYEYLLEELVKKGDIIKNKEFYTPFSITNLMSSIIDMGGKDIFDPNCGTGNFFISACQNAQKVVSGIENDISIYNICITNLFLHNINHMHIMYQTQIAKNEKYHMILTNPPFSQKHWTNKMSQEDLSYIVRNGLSINSVGDYAYVLSMLNHLTDDGRMAVVLPHGVLFRQNEKYVRKSLINYIDAIIGLPENLFYSNRISVIILILCKQKKEDNILFIDASKEYVNNRKNNVISDEIQKRIIYTYQKRRNIEHYSYVAGIEEIKQKQFDLSIKKYIEAEKAKIIKLSKKNVLKELKQLETKKANLEKQINEVLKSINL